MPLMHCGSKAHPLAKARASSSSHLHKNVAHGVPPPILMCKRERLSVEMKLLGPFGNSKQGHCPTHALNCCPESCWHKVNAQCWPCSFTVAPLHTPRPAVGTSVSNICCSTTSLSKSHLLKSKCSTTHKPSAVVVFLLALRC